MSLRAHRQAVAAMETLHEALDADGMHDLGDLADGWQVTQAGTVLARLRPLHPVELLKLARAIHPSAEAP
jgi:hypothetical protein